MDFPNPQNNEDAFTFTVVWYVTTHQDLLCSCGTQPNDHHLQLSRKLNQLVGEDFPTHISSITSTDHQAGEFNSHIRLIVVHKLQKSNGANQYYIIIFIIGRGSVGTRLWI